MQAVIAPHLALDQLRLFPSLFVPINIPSTNTTATIYRYRTLHTLSNMDFTRHFGPKVTQCERIIGYSFKSKLLCAEAMNAAADSQADYTVDGFIRMMPKNDRLAVYGDTAATFYLAGIWMDRGLEKRSLPC